MLERLRFGGFSGTYKIRNTTELARDKKVNTTAITVQFLDDTTHTFHVEKRAKGAELLDQVFEHLELAERDYFGLLFVQQPGDVVRWLDPKKVIRKQWNPTNDGAVPFRFAVKFYVTDPSRLHEEYTRYHFYLQIKRDIILGKLPCPLTTACLLASYTVQSELGDFNPLEHNSNYLKSMQLINEQNDETERRIAEFHKLHRGQLPSDAEYNYLEHAKKLYMYGVDLHRAIDSTGKEIELGVTSIGLVVFSNGTRINVFSWSKMVKISFKRKEFFLQLRREPTENYDTMLGFNMGSHKNAKALWKSCVEQHSFFRMERPSRSSRFLPLSLGSRFYYSGRTELQTVQESKQRGKIAKVFTRSPTKKLIGSPKVNGTNVTATVATSTTTTTTTTVTATTAGSSSIQTADNKVTVTNSSIKSHRSHDNKIQSKESETLPRKAWDQHSDDEHEPFERYRKTFQKIKPPTSLPLSNGDTSIKSANAEMAENLITIRLTADEQGRFGFNVRGGVDLKLPVLVSRVVPHSPAGRTKITEGDEVIKINGREVIGLLHDQVVQLIRESREFRAGELLLTVKQSVLGASTILARTKQREEKLNVATPLTGKALYHQSMQQLNDGVVSGSLFTQYERLYRRNPELPISDAKTAENLAKNRYRDISPYDCTRVVLLNSSTGDYINANYVNMEIANGGGINRYIATQGPLANTTMDFWRMVQQESSHLIVMLTTVIERGRLKCHQYWPTPGEELQMTDTFSVKCLNEMADATGSFVFREMQLCDKETGENRIIQHMQYLAWPDHGVPSDPLLFLEFTERVRAARKTTLLQEIDHSLKQMQLLKTTATTSENGIDIDANDNNNNNNNNNDTDNDDDDDDNDDDDTTAAATNANVNATNDMKNECNESGDIGDIETAIVSSAGESPEEIELPPSTSIHQFISAANPPIIVHCSAGIGRTGVLILMDTALSLMNVTAPVYPLDIVLTMRDQRACMVQTASQFRFVCECICAAYTSRISANDPTVHSDDAEQLPNLEVFT